ncbi:aldehyde dehydrogenase family protein [Nitrosospira multiformis]|uniref:Betaine-aldehyde dehydrogenase n=1 Tax=Nitrosospira multiformis TaxID=1231 RepID=A0A1I7GZM8_9PROT|nr:aldehyde dehydrogenase family protein [Nitrosospira multiformis]SFU53862.1 betaine-aldehyde dehydrogenase [Nitrosospira multiformis]
MFDTETQAVALANDSEYGLAASVWSRDADRPLRIARSIQAGTVWINDWMVLREGQAAYLAKKAAGEQ